MRRSTILAPTAVALLVGQNPDAVLAQAMLVAPTNLSALGSQTQIDIHWEENSQVETGFEVYRSATGAPNSFNLHTTLDINATAFTDQGLTPDAHFCYQVRAVRVDLSATIYSEFSNIACTTAAPVAIVSFEAVSTGGAHSCALTSIPGAAYCWGRGESGQLGMPAPPSTCLTDSGFFSCSTVPVPVGGGLTFEKLAGGGAHTCALTSDRTAYCWGNNAYGQLGDNSTISQTAPVPVEGGLTFVSIDAGAAHTCAVTSTGETYCWGRNDRGQLGDGTTTSSAVPVAVAGNLTFHLIAAGGFTIGHSCGLTHLGAAYCWGDNERGQLGTGTADTNPHVSPESVAGGLVFNGLTAGLGRHTCGLTGVGAYCWGENLFGALGNGSSRDSAVPVAVVGNLSFDQLIAGGFIGHTCGVIDGVAHCWGENEKGQVGDGTTGDRLVPVTVAGGLEFLSVDAGFRHTCGRASTGTVYCWGSGGAGQLGNNSNSLSTVPAEVFGQPSDDSDFPPDLETPDQYFEIVSRNSGKCLDVFGASADAGASVIQWICHGGPNQEWRLEPAGGGAVRIIARHSGQTLDVFGALLDDVTPIIQWPVHGGDNQSWTLESAGDGYVRIVARHSGKAMDVELASLDDGARVIQYLPHAGLNQQWLLRPVSSN